MDCHTIFNLRFCNGVDFIHEHRCKASCKKVVRLIRCEPGHSLGEGVKIFVHQGGLLIVGYQATAMQRVMVLVSGM